MQRIFHDLLYGGGCTCDGQRCAGRAENATDSYPFRDFRNSFHAAHQLLNSGGWWEPISLKAAICIGSPIRAFNTIKAQQRQTTPELQQFFPAENSFCLCSACRDRLELTGEWMAAMKFGGGIQRGQNRRIGALWPSPSAWMRPKTTRRLRSDPGPYVRPCEVSGRIRRDNRAFPQQECPSPQFAIAFRKWLFR